MSKKTWATPSGTAYNFYLDILDQPHTLIAGATGSGKSVILNGIIHTALFKCPNDINFIFCDPKMVELSKYANLPHTLKYADTVPAMRDALQYATDIMQSRFAEMKATGLQETDKRHIYVIVDEFSDLVTKGADSVLNRQKTTCEALVESIGQLGRAAHVHLILTTQFPDRKVIKAHIFQSMTAKIALRCDSAIESRQIIGQSGAELLPDYGDCLYKKPCFLQHYTGVPIIPDEDIDARIKWWTDQVPPPSLFSRLFGRSK